jgi:hypothetical protein
LIRYVRKKKQFLEEDLASFIALYPTSLAAVFQPIGT